MAFNPYNPSIEKDPVVHAGGDSPVLCARR